ncbi:TM2 domain-containing protein [Myxococcota bacterium]|nr:TM2 domain-containing protein [Myxococcota bacterium]
MKKSVGVSYLLFLVGGSAGLHRFYLGQHVSGAAMALGAPFSMIVLHRPDSPTSFGGWLLFYIAIAFLPWYIITFVSDPFLIPRRVRAYNRNRRPEMVQR